jgi:hypothetical protein
MNLDTYDLISDSNQEVFEFESIGLKGKIQKLVLFKETSFSGIYNLGFGDIDPETGYIDDKVVSDNGDGEIVLSTVVSTIHKFFDKHPHAQIYLSGSTKSRTRLYRIAINKYFELFSSKFEIMGELETHFERFTKNKEYQGFLIKLK